MKLNSRTKSSGKDEKRKILFSGIVISIFIFCIGFGVMYLFWMNDIQNPNLPGFFHYKAATYGDGICLPVLTACLLMYTLFYPKSSIKIIKKINLYSGIIGGMFLIIGMGVQLSWLLSDDTGLNWTIPKLHYFTISGWYHAFYFSFMFGGIAFLLTKAWMLKRFSHRISCWEQKMCLWGSVLSSTGYMLLHALDDWYSLYDMRALWGTLGGMCIFWTVYCVSAERDIRRFWEDVGILLSAGVSSYGIIIIALHGAPSIFYILLSAIAAFFSVGVIIPDEEQPSKGIHKAFMVLVAVFIFNMFLFRTNNFGIKTLMLSLGQNIILYGYAFLSYYPSIKVNRKREYIKILLMLLVPGYILLNLLRGTAILILGETEAVSQLYDLVLTAMLTFASLQVAKGYISDIFRLVQKKENSEKTDVITDNKTKLVVYFQICIVATGTFLFYFLGFILMPDVENQGFCLPSVTSIFKYFPLIFTMVTLGFISIIRNEKGRKLSAMLFLVLSYVFLILALWNRGENSGYNIVFLFFIFPVFGSAIMVSVGYYNNLCGLHGKKGDIFDIISAFIIGIGTAVLSTYSIINIPEEGASNETVIFCFVSGVLLICVGYILLPYLMGKNFKYEQIKDSFIKNSIISGILQDGFTSSLIMLLAGMLPSYYLRKMLLLFENKSSIAVMISAVSIAVILFIMTSIAQISWPLGFCMRNNVEHFIQRKNEYIEKYEKSEKNKELYRLQMNTLRKHILFQNWAAYISVTPYLMLYDIYRRKVGKAPYSKWLQKVIRVSVD